MLQRLYTQLPDFARPTHPLMRYSLLRRLRRQSLTVQALRLIFVLLTAGVLIFVGYQIATNNGTTPLDTPEPLDSVFLVLYWPLCGIQLLLRIFALTTTVGVISTETQRGTWDTLKVTTNGARLLLKARWAAVFYRLWAVLTALLLIRVFFIVVALINLSKFQGRYLDLLLSGTTPLGQPNISTELQVVAGIVIMAMMMTASLLAPFTAIAFDAGLGMFIGTLTRGRFIGVLGQLLLILIRVGITVFVLWLTWQILSFSSVFGPSATTAPGTALIDNQPVAWVSAFAGLVEGDLNLSLLNLDRVQVLWADIEYGVFLGVAALGYVLLQAALANGLVLWAGRRAANADKF